MGLLLFTAVCSCVTAERGLGWGWGWMHCGWSAVLCSEHAAPCTVSHVCVHAWEGGMGQLGKRSRLWSGAHLSSTDAFICTLSAINTLESLNLYSPGCSCPRAFTCLFLQSSAPLPRAPAVGICLSPCPPSLSLGKQCSEGGDTHTSSPSVSLLTDPVKPAGSFAAAWWL